MTCIGFQHGCTCSPCLTQYISRHAHSCTYGGKAKPVAPLSQCVKAKALHLPHGTVQGHG